jgi:hypothetical protein
MAKATNSFEDVHLNGEIFTYLGRMEQPRGAVHVWLHSQQPRINRPVEVIQRAAAEIYPTMIHEAMIRDYDAVLVFDMRQDTNGRPCISPVQISHERFPRLILGANDIILTWNRMLQTPRSPPYFIIGAEFKKDKPEEVLCCRTYELPRIPGVAETLSLMGRMPVLPGWFAPLVQYLCTKPIPYL